jgi:hypothetical protein
MEIERLLARERLHAAWWRAFPEIPLRQNLSRNDN